MIEYVTGFLFNYDCTEALLIKKTKPQWQAGLLNGVGGKIEPGENASQAMVREFQEEAGVLIGEMYWTQFAIITDPHEYNCYFFYTVDVSGVWFEEAKTQTEEELVRYPMQQFNCFATDKILNLGWLIPLALHSAFVTRYGNVHFVIE